MGKIEILGLGAGELSQLPYGLYEKLLETENLFLRTADHPIVPELRNRGISWQSFDSIYEAEADFAAVYLQIANHLLEEARDRDIVYAVPGHPLVAEDTVQLLLKNELGIPVTVLGGRSFLDDFFQAVAVDPIDGFQLVDAVTMEPERLDLGSHLVVMQVYDSLSAGEAKLSLMEKYPDEHPVALVEAAGTSRQSVKWVPLYEMDHLDGIHNLLTVYVPPLERDERTRSFATTQHYMDQIMAGDIWVQQQTHESLLPYLMEETAEVAEAIAHKDVDNLAEELGDILLQVIYHAGYAESQGNFTMEDVLEALNRKLRRRHPHVFDGLAINSIAELDAMWQAIKAQEKEDQEPKENRDL